MHTAPGTPLEISSHRFKELDALRGLAAWSVVLHHFFLVLPPSRFYTVAASTPLHLVINGPQAVVLFFVLSGFVLTGLWSRNTSGYTGYGAKRLTRLCLPFYAALAVAALLDLYFMHPLHVQNAWIEQTWTVRPTWRTLLESALTRQRWMEQLNTAFWSVAFEIRISMAFPLLYWFVLKVRSRFTVPVLLLGQLALPFAHPLDRYVNGGLLEAVIEFTVGIVLFRQLPKLLAFVSRLKPLHSRLFAGTFMLMYAVAVPAPKLEVVQKAALQESAVPLPVAENSKPIISLKTKLRRVLGTEWHIFRVQLGMLAAAGVMLSAIGLPAVRGALQQTLMLRIGALSYSTYLLHGTVLFALIRAFYGRFPFVYLLVPYLLLVYVVSEVFHALVDQPAVLLSRKVETFLAGQHS